MTSTSCFLSSLPCSGLFSTRLRQWAIQVPVGRAGFCFVSVSSAKLLLCWAFSSHTVLVFFPSLPEVITAGEKKIVFADFNIGVETLKYFSLMLVLLDNGWLPGTLVQSFIFKAVQVALPWVIYWCWNIEKPSTELKFPMMTLVWAAGRRSTMLSLVILLRTISILCSWIGYRNNRHQGQLPLYRRTQVPVSRHFCAAYCTRHKVF